MQPVTPYRKFLELLLAKKPLAIDPRFMDAPAVGILQYESGGSAYVEAVVMATQVPTFLPRRILVDGVWMIISTFDVGLCVTERAVLPTGGPGELLSQKWYIGPIEKFAELFRLFAKKYPALETLVSVDDIAPSIIKDFLKFVMMPSSSSGTYYRDIAIQVHDATRWRKQITVTNVQW